MSRRKRRYDGWLVVYRLDLLNSIYYEINFVPLLPLLFTCLLYERKGMCMRAIVCLWLANGDIYFLNGVKDIPYQCKNVTVCECHSLDSISLISIVCSLNMVFVALLISHKTIESNHFFVNFLIMASLLATFYICVLRTLQR